MGATLTVALWSVAPSGLVRDLLFVVVGLLGVAGAFVGIRLNKPPRPAAWYLLAAGQLVFVSGDVVYTWYLDVQHVEPYPRPPTPSTCSPTRSSPSGSCCSSAPGEPSGTWPPSSTPRSWPWPWGSSAGC
ncbi:hypothetical protein [Cellulomonas soli]